MRMASVSKWFFLSGMNGKLYVVILKSPLESNGTNFIYISYSAPVLAFGDTFDLGALG